jgi:hypothetical protein
MVRANQHGSPRHRTHNFTSLEEMPRTYSWAEAAAAFKEVMLQTCVEMETAVTQYLALCTSTKVDGNSVGGVDQTSMDQAAERVYLASDLHQNAKIYLSVLTGPVSDWHKNPESFGFWRDAFPDKPALHKAPMNPPDQKDVVQLVTDIFVACYPYLDGFSSPASILFSWRSSKRARPRRPAVFGSRFLLSRK